MPTPCGRSITGLMNGAKAIGAFCCMRFSSDCACPLTTIDTWPAASAVDSAVWPGISCAFAAMSRHSLLSADVAIGLPFGPPCACRYS